MRFSAVRACVAVAALACLASGPGRLPAQAAAAADPLLPLRPLLGHWQGKGQFVEIEQTTNWQGSCSFTAVLGGHWLRGDSELRFDGMDQALFQRHYLGHDRARQRLLAVVIDSGGQLLVDELRLEPDGTLLQLGLRRQQQMVYAERIRRQLGEAGWQQQVELLLPAGSSLPIVSASYQRSASDPALQLPTSPFAQAAVAEPMRRLAKLVGRYAFEGAQAVSVAGPPLPVQGLVTWQALFGGLVLQASSESALEGAAQLVRSETYCAFDPRRQAVVAVTFGDDGSFCCEELQPTADGKAWLAIATVVIDGEPALQRTVFGLDDAGRLLARRTDLLRGTAEPYTSFRASYARK